jgi:predicted metal-dependent hydrolase
MDVTVIRSRKRTRSSAARVIDGRIEVRIPAWMSAQEEHETVSSLVARLSRRDDAARIDLMTRARRLARRHDLPLPASIAWASNQAARWGSCSIETADIRISDRLARFPIWVLDAVIVHELAHLVEPDHSPAFWAVVNRYPKAERALGFLMAHDLGLADAGEDDSATPVPVLSDDDCGITTVDDDPEPWSSELFPDL